ncbi:helix-turn-helix domain-containing protein [Planococcus shenhongbingii]|uniref:helix-turn-helix domain-containing protein n=1 Tax=Planococcus shenhongbingii TaxID=3058398 RepID=UPI00260E439D|nr:helix-turn-helix domain-containing protein [Planococcus sp. N016]WKA57799.1 helix-turn-helix domain-containing protein [Planococcus sp. N016]
MNTDIGPLIRGRRKEMGLSQETLAEKAQVSERTIRRISKSRHCVRYNLNYSTEMNAKRPPSMKLTDFEGCLCVFVQPANYP